MQWESFSVCFRWTSNVLFFIHFIRGLCVSIFPLWQWTHKHIRTQNANSKWINGKKIKCRQLSATSLHHFSIIPCAHHLHTCEAWKTNNVKIGIFHTHLDRFHFYYWWCVCACRVLIFSLLPMTYKIVIPFCIECECTIKMSNTHTQMQANKQTSKQHQSTTIYGASQ